MSLGIVQVCDTDHDVGHIEVIPAVNPGIKTPLSEAECSGVCRLHEKGVGRGWGFVYVG